MVPAPLFPTDPTIGYPFFNTYRLASTSTLKASTQPLPNGHTATASRFKAGTVVDNGSRSAVLGLKEVKARVGWDHLACGAREDEFVFVDEDYRVVMGKVTGSGSELSTTFKRIAELVVPLGARNEESTPEYPSVLAVPGEHTSALGKDIYLASSGIGTLSIIPVPTSITASSTSGDDAPQQSTEIDLVISGEPPSRPYPFLLHSLHVNDLTSIELILSRTIRAPDPAHTSSPTPGSSKSARIAPKIITTFEVVCVRLDLSPGSAVWAEGIASTSRVEVKWRVRGEEFPNLVIWGGGRWTIGGPCLYELVGGHVGAGPGLEQTDSDTKQDGRTTAGQDANPIEQTSPSDEQTADYPYSWSQTRSTLELSFHFPTTLDPTRDILCVIKTHSLLLRLAEDRRDGLTPSQAAWFRLGAAAEGDGLRDWWDAVKAKESTWTWEKSSEAGGNGNGTMTLHLEKANAGVKWPQPFAPLQNDGDELAEEDNDLPEAAQEIEVPETVSEEDQAATKAGLEQFHSAAAEAGVGVGMGGIGSRNALPGLLREEMEDEDYDDGDEGGGGLDGGDFASLGASGSSKAGKLMRFMEVVEDVNGVRVKPFDKEPASWVLSSSLGESSGASSSIILKSHVDGQVYTAPSTARQRSWTHVASNPALSFVLSSKRDAQYVYHFLSEKGATVLAFESRQANGVGGNAYVYWPVEYDANKGKTASGKSKAEEGRQAVVKMDEDAKGDTGVLLGVKLIKVAGKRVVVGLAEQALVFLTGV